MRIENIEPPPGGARPYEIFKPRTMTGSSEKPMMRFSEVIKAQVVASPLLVRPPVAAGVIGSAESLEGMVASGWIRHDGPRPSSQHAKTST